MASEGLGLEDWAATHPGQSSPRATSVKREREIRELSCRERNACRRVRSRRAARWNKELTPQW